MAGGFEFRLTIPQLTDSWWDLSRRELARQVEEYDKRMQRSFRDPVTLKKWQPRKQPTGTWPLLRKTGEMEDSARYYTRPGDIGKFYVGTVYYGPYQQYGTKNMPARPWVGIGRPVLDPMAKTIGNVLFKKSMKTLRAG